ncbi:MAG: hypothetical protein V7742_11360 [Halioglobus sp.]
MKLLIPTLLILATLTACENKPPVLTDPVVKERDGLLYLAKSTEPLTAEVQRWHDDGGYMKKHYIVIKGKREGLYQSWWSAGAIHIERNYANGKLEGLSRSWHPDLHPWNHQQNTESSYTSGKKDGLSLEWYPNGKLASQNNYVNGKSEGLQSSWYENGTPIRTDCFKGGRWVDMSHCEE